jgi:hypothetical protein
LSVKIYYLFPSVLGSAVCNKHEAFQGEQVLAETHRKFVSTRIADRMKSKIEIKNPLIGKIGNSLLWKSFSHLFMDRIIFEGIAEPNNLPTSEWIDDNKIRHPSA